LQAVNDSDKNNSGAAEYEIYFNYLRYIKEDIAVREPNYVDTGDFNFGINSSFDFFAYHWHMRDNL